GIPAERLGGAMGRLARENAMRNPQRTARTAGALMIGLALITLVATLGAGLKATDRDALRHQVAGDYVLSTKESTTYPAAAGAAVAHVPGVVTASSVRADRARVGKQTIDVSGLEPQTIASVYN